jgi:hypothetical protein
MNNININIDIKYIFLLFIVVIFYLYGLILSEIIDYVFPEYNDAIDDFRIIIEIIGEIGIAYLIYFSLKHYSEHLIKILYKNISRIPPTYLNELLLIAFSIGIFKHLEKSSNKLLYIKNKIINY